MRWPFTKWVAGTCMALLRPGSASSFAGIVGLLRNSAMAQLLQLVADKCGDAHGPTQGRRRARVSPCHCRAACRACARHLKLWAMSISQPQNLRAPPLEKL